MAGEMNVDKSNVILHPTSFGATHTDLMYRVGPGKLLDTSKYVGIIMAVHDLECFMMQWVKNINLCGQYVRLVVS